MGKRDKNGQSVGATVIVLFGALMVAALIPTHSRYLCKAKQLFAVVWDLRLCIVFVFGLPTQEQIVMRLLCLMHLNSIWYLWQTSY